MQGSVPNVVKYLARVSGGTWQCRSNRLVGGGLRGGGVPCLSQRGLDAK